MRKGRTGRYSIPWRALGVWAEVVAVPSQHSTAAQAQVLWERLGNRVRGLGVAIQSSAPAPAMGGQQVTQAGAWGCSRQGESCSWLGFDLSPDLCLDLNLQACPLFLSGSSFTDSWVSLMALLPLKQRSQSSSSYIPWPLPSALTLVLSHSSISWFNTLTQQNQLRKSSCDEM